MEILRCDRCGKDIRPGKALIVYFDVRHPQEVNRRVATFEGHLHPLCAVEVRREVVRTLQKRGR